MQRIFWIIIVGIVVVVLAVAYYNHRSARHAVESGDVFVHDQASDNAKSPAPDTGSPNQTEQPGAAAGADQQGVQPEATGSPTPNPAADSVPRNPPNGMLFAGTGKYQLYRQGDITWRLNTDTGEAFILFATDAEWSKPRVYQHGCGPSSAPH
jgi:hypothetical protein